MSAAHTPGPWEALPPVKSEDRTVYVQVRAKRERLATICVYGKNEKLETGGKTYKDRFGDERHEPIITGAEAIANATLIAAAPDLLASLREAVETAPHTFECKPTRDFNARLKRGETVTLSQAYDVDGECDCWKSRALAAIAKAEGRKP